MQYSNVQSNNIITVVIIDDDPNFRAALADAVTNAHDMQLLGVADDLPLGLQLLKKCKPNVLLVDIGLPSGSGITLIEQAQQTLPHCESMVVTVFADDKMVLDCIEAGATGYLLKDSSEIDIVQQIRLLRGGGSPISPAIARRLLLRVCNRSDTTSYPLKSTITLSAQEQSVLSFSSKGYHYGEIANMLNVSRYTVETYVKRIYRKLQVSSKTEAVYEARKLGLVDD